MVNKNMDDAVCVIEVESQSTEALPTDHHNHHRGTHTECEWKDICQ